MYLFRARDPRDQWKAEALNRSLAAPLERLDGDRLRMLLGAFLVMLEHQQRVRALLAFGAVDTSPTYSSSGRGRP